MNSIAAEITQSDSIKITEKIAIMIKTTTVVVVVSLRVGQVTFWPSCFTSRENWTMSFAGADI